MNNQLGKKLAAVSGKNVSIDPEEHYDLWAKQYEKELLEDYGYCAHIIGSKAFSTYELRKSCNIIDIAHRKSKGDTCQLLYQIHLLIKLLKP